MKIQKEILTDFLKENKLTYHIFDSDRSIMLIELGIVIPVDGDIVLSEEEWLRICVSIGEKKLTKCLTDISQINENSKVVHYDFRKEEIK